MTALRWVIDHRVLAGVGAAALALLLGAGGWARCHGSAAPAVTQHVITEADKRETRDTTRAADTDTKRTQAPTVRERYDAKTGLLTERLTLGEVTTVVTAKVDTIKHEEGHVVTHVDTLTVIEPAKPSALGVSVAPLWGKLQLRPSEVTVSADVPIGKVLGIQLRAGPAARWSSGAAPDGYGIVLRGEF